ncbi:hypothetical protein PIB30_077761 [Stylosanthes scabra]|uniref:Transmembrane protein n=1 Tax=Stylosanthes scabra TaxID=79078 RepID=A0ABU6RR82_9FABA|nr:hypothetical protein [Stylosanthes scabra]
MLICSSSSLSSSGFITVDSCSSGSIVFHFCSVVGLSAFTLSPTSQLRFNSSLRCYSTILVASLSLFYSISRRRHDLRCKVTKMWEELQIEMDQLFES